MNKILLVIIVVIALGVILFVLAAWKTSRAGYETAAYETVSTDGAFEIRDYASLTLVEAPMGGNGSGDRSFGRLFGYISGKNSSEEKIAMTTPVFMTESADAPESSGSGSNRNMAFVMPATMAAESTPRPADATLSVRSLPPARYATFRFSGTRSAGSETEALDKLREWMKANGYPALSAPVYGYFDPPWTPGFLRRNEVMIETSAPVSPPVAPASQNQ